MSGKEESFTLKPCSTGSMETEEAALVRRVGKEASSLKPCNQKGGSLILEPFFSMKPCSNGSTASAGAFTGKDFSLKRCSMEDIAGKQASSLTLCPTECMSMEGIIGEQESKLKLYPTESLRMENINGEQECSLKMCDTKRKAPTAGYLPPLKGGAIKRKGEEYCSEGDTLATADVEKCAEVAISDTKVAAAFQKGALGILFSEEYDTGDEEFDWSTEEEGDDDDVILPKAEFQLVMNRASEKYDRFIERLRARNKTMLIKDYTSADFVDSDDEDVIHDHTKVEVAL